MLPEARPIKHFDQEFWQRWEGQTIGGKFVLDRLTAFGGTGASYETSHRGRAALIRFFPGTSEEVAARRKSWREAAGLSHPALVEVYSRGETTFDEALCAYIVMERPDRNTEANLAREALAALIGVLRYLHERSFAHGELNAGELLPYGGQWKLSSHTLTPSGDTNADCAVVGELVKQSMNGNPTPPLAQIVKGAAAGWSAARMEACLLGKQATRRKLWAGGVAAVVLTGVFAFRPAPTTETPPPVVAELKTEPRVIQKPAPASPPAPTPAAKPKPAKPEPPKPTAAPTPPKPVESKPTASTDTDGVARVMPDIPSSARRTIRGRVRVNVRVTVDPDGRVTQATSAPPAASAYFTTRVLAAARSWKFPPASAPSEWMLRFELLRGDTRVSAAKAR